MEATMNKLDTLYLSLTKQDPTQEPYMSAGQLAKHLDMKPDTINKKFQRGQIPGYKLGYSRRYKLSEVIAALKTI